MKIQHVSIQNYRSIESLDLDLDDYAAFVGANGSGKSSVLYAINWLVNGGNLDASDVHGVGSELAGPTGSGAAPEADAGPEKVVSVTVTFSDLNTLDRARLEKYGRGKTAVIRRSWSPADAKAKVVGRALQGPNFISVRNAGSVGEARTAYAALREMHGDLAEPERLPKKEELDRLLTLWEDDPKNAELLEAIEDDEATSLFGFDGQNRLKQCVRVVLVPAASDISSEVAGAKRGSAVNELIGVLMSEAGAAAREAWIVKHEKAIQELTENMRAGVENATGFQAERINERLSALVAGAELAFVSEVPGWVPSPATTVNTDISIDGIKNDVSKQGHGIQRAVMIAMFQSLAPDERVAARELPAMDGESAAETEARLELAKQNLPSLVVCIEEPEIYQHPVRARSFARVLVELSTQGRVQVVVATHSPYFVKPANFESLRRFTLTAGKSAVKQTNVDAVTTRLGGGASRRQQVEKVVNQQLPTTFSEGFFADAVVLVEGDTDKAVLEEVAEKLGTPFDAAGISVLDMSGKGNLKIPASMLFELGIPTYVVADGDALGANRKHPADTVKAEEVRRSHKGDTDSLMAWLPPSSAPTVGTLPFEFGNPTVVCENYCVWHDDLENELMSWPSFVASQTANGHEVRGKDMLAYRADVMTAGLDDLPASLRALVDGIHAFRRRN